MDSKIFLSILLIFIIISIIYFISTLSASIWLDSSIFEPSNVIKFDDTHDEDLVIDTTDNKIEILFYINFNDKLLLRLNKQLKIYTLN